MYKYIENPTTNKKFKISSYEGLNILKKYIIQMGGSSKKPKKSPKITEIKGPISLYLWDITCPNKSKKKILLIGDEHSNINDICVKSNNNCYNLDNFLIKIMKMASKKNKCIDLFLEEKQKKRSGPLYLKGGKFNKNSKLLSEIKQTFYNCAHHAIHSPSLSKKCGYDNLRFHNFDLRFSNNVPYENRTSNKLDILLYNSTNPTGYNHKRDYNLMANYILAASIKKTDIKRLNKLIGILSSTAVNIITPSYSKIYSVEEIKKDMTNFRRIVKKEYKKYLKTKNEYIPRKNRKLRNCLKYIINKKYNKTKQLN